MERDRRFPEEYPDIIQNWRAAMAAGFIATVGGIGTLVSLSNFWVNAEARRIQEAAISGLAAELVGTATIVAAVAVYNYLSSREASED